jgi:aminoglycoside-2''-adenylyltransferase
VASAPLIRPIANQGAFEAPKRVTACFADHSISWCVAGGWAVDLFLGRQTRPHGDLEVAVYRRDQQLLRDVFKDWAWSKVVPTPTGGGTKVPWNEQDSLELPIHQLYAEGPRGEALEILLQESSDCDWKFRRELSVTMPLASVCLKSTLDIPILRPDIQPMH